MNSQVQPIQLAAGAALPGNVPLQLLSGTKNIQSITIDNYTSCTIALYPNQNGNGPPSFLVQPYTYKTVTALNQQYYTVAFEGQVVQDGYCFIEWDDNISATPQQGSLQTTVNPGVPYLFPFSFGQSNTFDSTALGMPLINGVYIDNSTNGNCTVVANSQGTQTPYLVPPNCRLWMNTFVATSVTVTNSGTSGFYYAGVTTAFFPDERLESKANNGSYLQPIPGTPFDARLFQATPASGTFYSVYTVPANTTLYVTRAMISVDGGTVTKCGIWNGTTSSYICVEPSNNARGDLTVPAIVASGKSVQALCVYSAAPTDFDANIGGFTIP